MFAGTSRGISFVRNSFEVNIINIKIEMWCYCFHITSLFRSRMRPRRLLTYLAVLSGFLIICCLVFYSLSSDSTFTFENKSAVRFIVDDSEEKVCHHF